MKDFDNWNGKKKKIEYEIPNELVFQEREVWYGSIGINIGDEQDGKNELYERPVLVIKKFNKSLALVVTMISGNKSGPYYHHVPSNMGGFTIVLSQLRIVSAKRLNRRIFKVPEAAFELVIQKLVEMIKK
jgi:mRNA-degrading endonuclease toxin of MazEF toxin-antitoxin module